MTGLLIFLCLLLIAVVVVQIGKVTELSASIRGQEDAERSNNNFNARFSLVFMVGFLAYCFISAYYYKNDILWFGPHQSASAHGGELDSMFNITLFFTGIVFVVCHIALFWFAYKFKGQKGRKALFMPHDNKLEIIWTVIPAVVMCFLVIRGLVAWNVVMADVPEGEEHIEIEATGQQFFWTMRYPGPDGLLGERYYRDISATNPLGQVWTDTKNHDDVVSTSAGEVIKLPVNKKVRVRITAKDVLHNFDLPHFRVKMDAIPGLPTYFVFTPTVTTEEYRQNLGALDQNGDPLYPEWHTPADPEEPDGPKRWEAFNYELACAELCGKGHYSMRRIIEIVSEEEYEDWAAKQASYYMGNIRNSDEDPFKGQLLDIEIEERAKDFRSAVNKALAATEEADKIIRLNYVNFKTGSYELTENSSYELRNLANTLTNYPNMKIEVAGHTD
ncbi:MAG: preprotein translocase subunit SecG, partial [Bacteroidota bacterium]